MDFKLSSEQDMLRNGLSKFLAGRYDLDRSRAAAKTGAGWQPEIWRAFADDAPTAVATFGAKVDNVV